MKPERTGIPGVLPSEITVTSGGNVGEIVQSSLYGCQKFSSISGFLDCLFCKTAVSPGEKILYSCAKHGIDISLGGDRALVLR